MSTKLKRITFAVTKEMEPLLDRVKKNVFYDRNQSEMIREIIMVGLEVIESKIEKKS